MRAPRAAPLMLTALAAAAACGEGGEAPIVPEDVLAIHAESDQVVFGLKHYVTSDGIRRAHIVADTAFFLENQTAVDLRTLEVEFFGGDGVLTSILTSRTGTYDWNTGDMTARDSVVVVNPAQGRRVETSVMHYDRVRSRIWSDQPTTMYEADGTVIEGTAFDSDASLTEINLTSARIETPASDAEQPEP